MTIGYLWREHAATDGVTELRVHGVGGTTPESMLFDDRPMQVAGDGLAGFYRTDDCPGRHVEAYSWGGLTSRSGTRALWLLLLPFTLANGAGWMQAHSTAAGAAEQDPRKTLRGALLQLLSLLLTAQVVAGVGVLAMDLVAYQCGGQAICVKDRWWLWPFTQLGLPDHPGRRLVLGAAVPVALLAVFLHLGRRSSGRYEAKHPPSQIAAATDRVPLLLRRSTWENGQEIARARWAHVAGGVAVVAGLLALAGAALADERDRSPTPGRAVAVAAGTVLLLAAASLVARGRLSWAVLALGTLSLAGAVAVALRLPRSGLEGPTAPLEGTARVGEGVFAVQVLLLVLTALAGLGCRVVAARRREVWPRAFRWEAPAVLSGLAVLLTGAFFGGAMLRLADTLGKPVDAASEGTTSAESLLRVPPAYDWMSALFLGTLVAVLLLAVLPFWWSLRPTPERVKAQVQDWPDGARDCVKAIAKARLFAGRVRRLEFDTRISATIAIVVTVTIVAFAVRLGGGRVEAFGELPEWASPGRTAASWVITFLPVAAIGLVANGYRSPDRRRTIGIVWDLATFWPRWFHPLAPPCYAERAVPDLQCRLLQLTGPNGRVILSAHSQGSIWTTVALNMLPEENLKRIAYLTYGSPLSYLYPALFPDHFPAATRGLSDKLFPGFPSDTPAGSGGPIRWRNLWRSSDPIGGPVTLEDGPLDDGRPLADPSGTLTTCGACRPISGHSHYLKDRALVEYTEAVAQALQTHIAPAPAPTAPAR